MARFTNKTVVVTGSSRGLGRSIALALGKEKARVFVGYRTSADSAIAVVDEILSEGGHASALQIDVRDDASVESALGKIQSESQRIDVLINNAGVLQEGHLATLSTDDWNEAFDVNVAGAFRCARRTARMMIAKKEGVIVNVSSAAALRSKPGQSAYAVSKAAMLGLTRALALELGPYNIRVNSLVPGLLDVGMGQRVSAQRIEETTNRVPLKRVGRASEAAKAALFLASDDSSYMTGQALIVDGGLTL